MRAAVLTEPGRIEMAERPIPTGVFRNPNTWPTAIALVETGRVNLGAMVTAHFPLEKAAEALESDRTPGSVKSVVTVL